MYSCSPQESIRRLLSTNDASSEFNTWCEQELRKFNTDVDGMCGASFPDCVASFWKQFHQRNYPTPVLCSLQLYSCTCIWSHSQTISAVNFRLVVCMIKYVILIEIVKLLKPSWSCIHLIGKFNLTFLDNKPGTPCRVIPRPVWSTLWPHSQTGVR